MSLLLRTSLRGSLSGYTRQDCNNQEVGVLVPSGEGARSVLLSPLTLLLWGLLLGLAAMLWPWYWSSQVCTHDHRMSSCSSGRCRA